MKQVIAALCFVFVAGSVQAAGLERSLLPLIRPVLADQAQPVVYIPKMARPKPRPQAGTGALEIKTASSNAGFQRWIDGFEARARARGISQKTLDKAFKGISYNAAVVAKDRNQSEFTKQIWDYLDSATSDTRIKNGKSALRREKRTLDKIEKYFGVDRDVVVAIWGLESAYGEFRGDINTIEALATLAFDGRRGSFFESQLVAALSILQSGDVPARRMTGSWAGAMGHTQFIPTSYLAFAVDFTGDGKRDIWSNDPTDALASTAAYLKKSGWVKGQPWGVEVRLPKGFNYGLANRKTRKAPGDWAALGIRAMDGSKVPNYGSASILLPAGAAGAAFMIFKNFSVIERYNVADAYVIGVGHLSDRITGKPPIQASWPRGYAPLSFKEKKDMQRRLTRKGFLDDKIDGIIGPNTINAIREFQRSVGATPDGYPSQTLMKLLKS